MAKAKRSKAVDVHKIAAKKGKRLTGERMMKLRPLDPEPVEIHGTPEALEKALAEVEPEEGKKKPKQARLPGIQDPEIEELETLAEEYVSFRDRRQELTLDEVRLKQELLNAMQRYNRESYVHGGIEIKVIHKDTTVKVKVHKEED
jgi:hypothetical protein